MHTVSMPNVLIRDLDPTIHSVLAARAESRGQSLQQYLTSELALIASRPTVPELLAALEAAAIDLARLRVELHPTLPLVPHVLALRRNVTAYDAASVALASVFGCTLLTHDRRLARAASGHCTVEVPVTSD